MRNNWKGALFTALALLLARPAKAIGSDTLIFDPLQEGTAGVSRLLSDYQEKPFHLESTGVKDGWIVADFSWQSPNLRAEEWYAGAVVPPSIRGTELFYMGIKCEGADPSWTVSPDPSSPLKRMVWSVFPALPSSPNALRLQSLYHVRISGSHLMPGAAKEPVPALKAEERRAALAATPLFDIDSPEFQRWLRENGLKKEARESSLAFAFRVVTYERKVRKYALPYEFKPASYLTTCSTGECGMLSTLFTSILRANKIPARILSGEWLPKFDHHSRVEFYVDKIGWVPVDASGAVSGQDGDWTYAFGNQYGEFFTDQIDFEYPFDGHNEWGVEAYYAYPRKWTGDDVGKTVKVKWKLLAEGVGPKMAKDGFLPIAGNGK